MQNKNERVQILIVEDSPTQAAKLQALLEKHGYHVQSAKNGREALDYLTQIRSDRQLWLQYRPTIIISDIVMPEVTGYELCHQLKLDEELKTIPVILLTSLTDSKEALRGLYSGADNLIAKPYEDSFLLSRVDEMLANLQIGTSPDPKKVFTINMFGQKYSVSDERLRMINVIFTTYETAVRKNVELAEAKETIRQLEEKLREALKMIDQQEEELTHRV